MQAVTVEGSGTDGPLLLHPGPGTSAGGLLRRLLEEFVKTARERRTEPLIVYLPSRFHFEAHGPLVKDRVGEILAARGIEVHDLTRCLTARVPPAQLFLEGKAHYSGKGNEAVAKCVQPLVATFLGS